MKVSVNYPGRPKGSMIEVPGLGLFKNGTTTQIDRDGDDISLPDGQSETPEPDTESLEDMTVDELKREASEQNIEGSSYMKKDELIEALSSEESE